MPVGMRDSDGTVPVLSAVLMPPRERDGRARARSSALLSASVVSMGATATLESLPALTRKGEAPQNGARQCRGSEADPPPARTFRAVRGGASLPRVTPEEAPRPTDTSSVMGGLQTSRSGVLSAPSPYQFQLVVLLLLLLLLLLFALLVLLFCMVPPRRVAALTSRPSRVGRWLRGHARVTFHCTTVTIV